MLDLNMKLFIETLKLKIQNSFFNAYSRQSYSQEGEDLILSEIFCRKDKGFYIDIGAHHPYRFSNTYLFYKKGWNGINIDPMPNIMEKFQKVRPRDINLEYAISDKLNKLTYHIFNETALNGFSKELSESRDGIDNYKIIKTIDIETKTLENVLDKYLPKGQIIDFLSIDVEGFDFEVLRSNNWEKYHPSYLLIEILNFDVDHSSNEMYVYIKNLNYMLVAKTNNNLIFKRRN